MKRFWDTAATEQEGGAYRILLDGRPVRLPGGPALHLPARPLAEAIAGEWQAAGGEKGGEMDWSAVPLTRLAGTAQERVVPDPEPSVDALAGYGETDLLCYRATHPSSLVLTQARAWGPWVDWAARTLGAELRVTEGVIHVRQSPEALAALRRAVAAHDGWALAGLGILVPALGSLVLSLAVSRGELDAAEAHRLATLDEAWQVEQWGEDEEAAARRRAVGEDVALGARYLALLKDRPT